MPLIISRQWIVAVLAVLVAGIIAASVLQDILVAQGVVRDKLYLLDVDAEVSFNNWYSLLLHYTCFLLLTLIGAQKLAAKDRSGYQWLILALVFLFLSSDEALSIHEKIAVFINHFWHFSGWFFYSWIIPWFILTVVGFISFIPWLRAIPGRIRWQMIIAAVVFVTGAVILESAGSKLFTLGFGKESWPYRVETNFEEGMELAGLVLFIDALLRYQVATASRLVLQLR